MMKKSNTQTWLKVGECAVVGLATWFVAYGGIFDVAPAVPNPAHCPVASSQGAETGAQQRQLLLVLLKVSFQVLLALREGTQETPANQIFWIKLVLWLAVGQ